MRCELISTYLDIDQTYRYQAIRTTSD